MSEIRNTIFRIENLNSIKNVYFIKLELSIDYCEIWFEILLNVSRLELKILTCWLVEQILVQLLK